LFFSLPIYDITVQQSNSTTSTTRATTTEFSNVSATLLSPTVLSATLTGALKRAIIVPQTQVHGAAGSERLRIFSSAHAVTVLLRPWAAAEEALSADARSVAGRGALRAPMPSLVVEVRVAVGERVEKGQVVVVLESMKTETVLRAPVDGIVKAVGCAKGEMAEEGKELVGTKRIRAQAIDGVANNAVLNFHPARMIFYSTMVLRLMVVLLLYTCEIDLMIVDKGPRLR
jgi:3-methylcrotonyl-CoA carboxylase alpha subunit